MILTKTKSSKSGAALIICLIIILFLSLLGTMNFNATRTELKIAGNINAKNIKFQASEKAINITLENKFDQDSLDKTLKMKPSEIEGYCVSGDALYDNKNCKGKYLNEDKSVTSTSTLELNNTNECFAYGNSDQKAQCFILKGTGNIPVLNKLSEIHVQELQVNTANLGNNGVYDL